MELVKASLTHLGSLEKLEVMWNPERYAVSRRSHVVHVGGWGTEHSPPQAVVGGAEKFTADLLLDSTRLPANERDLRPVVEKLERWMQPAWPEPLPEALLFSWGSFRFRGILVALDQIWVRFDPDGTPVRGWIRMALRK